MSPSRRALALVLGIVGIAIAFGVVRFAPSGRDDGADNSLNQEQLECGPGYADGLSIVVGGTVTLMAVLEPRTPQEKVVALANELSPLSRRDGAPRRFDGLGVRGVEPPDCTIPAIRFMFSGSTETRRRLTIRLEDLPEVRRVEEVVPRP